MSTSPSVETDPKIAANGAVPMIRLSWKVESQYVQEWTPKAFASLIERKQCGECDPHDLDSIYDWLDGGSWRAEEFLRDLAGDYNWCADGDVEVIDLIERAGS